MITNTNIDIRNHIIFILLLMTIYDLMIFMKILKIIWLKKIIPNNNLTDNTRNLIDLGFGEGQYFT